LSTFNFMFYAIDATSSKFIFDENKKSEFTKLKHN